MRTVHVGMGAEFESEANVTPPAEIKQHATIGSMERERLEAIAREKGKTPEQLTLEWSLNPAKAPKWFLAAMASQYHRVLGTKNNRALSAAQLSDRGQAGGHAKSAARRWGGSTLAMRDDWRKLQEQAGQEAYDAKAMELGIDPNRFTEAGADANAAFVRLRDALGLTPKRPNDRRWKGSVPDMLRDFARLRKLAGARKYDAGIKRLNMDPASFTKAGATEWLKFRALCKTLGVTPAPPSRKAI